MSWLQLYATMRWLVSHPATLLAFFGFFFTMMFFIVHSAKQVGEVRHHVGKKPLGH